MSEPIITVGGLPGSGTSTLCRILAANLGIPYTYAGAIFRAEAENRGLSLAEFGALCQEDQTVDKALDDEQVRMLQEAGRDGLLLEGRLAGHMAILAEVRALKIWVDCDEETRIERITERDGGDIEDQARSTAEREASEADRYQRYYGIQLDDLSIYDLVLDSTDMGPDDLADAVEAALDAHTV